MKTEEEKKELKRRAEEQARRWAEGKDRETLPDIKDIKLLSKREGK